MVSPQRPEGGIATQDAGGLGAGADASGGRDGRVAKDGIAEQVVASAGCDMRAIRPRWAAMHLFFSRQGLLWSTAATAATLVRSTLHGNRAQNKKSLIPYTISNILSPTLV